MDVFGRRCSGAAFLGLAGLVNTGKLDKFFFSRPSDIAARIVEWFRTGSIWPHLIVTIEEAALAFAIGRVRRACCWGSGWRAAPDWRAARSLHPAC